MCSCPEGHQACLPEETFLLTCSPGYCAREEGMGSDIIVPLESWLISGNPVKPPWPGGLSVPAAESFMVSWKEGVGAWNGLCEKGGR